MDIYKMREMKNAIRRIESTSKVTGTAQYLDDLGGACHLGGDGHGLRRYHPQPLSAREGPFH